MHTQLFHAFSLLGATRAWRSLRRNPIAYFTDVVGKFIHRAINCADVRSKRGGGKVNWAGS